MGIDLLNESRLVLPGLLISITSSICPNLKDSAIDVSWRPPGYVFAIVWPVLYITTGFAWRLSKNDLMFSLIILNCCLWLLLYSCRSKKKLALIPLILSALLSWATVLSVSNTRAKLLLLPLAIWLTFASSINIEEVRLARSKTI